MQSNLFDKIVVCGVKGRRNSRFFWYSLPSLSQAWSWQRGRRHSEDPVSWPLWRPSGPRTAARQCCCCHQGEWLLACSDFGHLSLFETHDANWKPSHFGTVWDFCCCSKYPESYFLGEVRHFVLNALNACLPGFAREYPALVWNKCFLSKE